MFMPHPVEIIQPAIYDVFAVRGAIVGLKLVCFESHATQSGAHPTFTNWESTSGMKRGTVGAARDRDSEGVEKRGAVDSDVETPKTQSGKEWRGAII